MKGEKKETRKEDEPEFYNTANLLCKYKKHKEKATHGKDGRSIVHRRASQGDW